MKIMAIHDAQGNISATVVLPTDAPPGAIRVEPGQTITEIDGHNLKFDAQKEQSYERLREVIQNFRIEPIPSRAKLDEFLHRGIEFTQAAEGRGLQQLASCRPILKRS